MLQYILPFSFNESLKFSQEQRTAVFMLIKLLIEFEPKGVVKAQIAGRVLKV